MAWFLSVSEGVMELIHEIDNYDRLKVTKNYRQILLTHFSVREKSFRSLLESLAKKFPGKKSSESGRGRKSLEIVVQVDIFFCIFFFRNEKVGTFFRKQKNWHFFRKKNIGIFFREKRIVTLKKRIYTFFREKRIGTFSGKKGLLLYSIKKGFVLFFREKMVLLSESASRAP